VLAASGSTEVYVQAVSTMLKVAGISRTRRTAHPRPVRPRQAGMRPGPLAQGDRELMAQHLPR